MNYLEKLLNGAKVEWKKLGEVADYVRGLTYNKSNESGDDTGYKILRANNITLSDKTINFDDIKYIKFDTKVNESYKLFKNDILICAASGSREHVGKVAYIFSDLDYYFGGFMGVVRCSSQIEPRFLFHILTSGIFQKYLDEMLNSSTINNLNSSVMNGLQIPLPPLSVQQEIVRILDTFSALTAELTAELTARKKQYEYYRNSLLNFTEKDNKNHLSELSGGVIWKTLGEVLTIKNGKDYKKFQFGNIPVYGTGGVMTFIDTYVYNKPSVLIPRKGSLANLYYVDVPFWTVDTIFWTDINTAIIKPKFVYYYLKMQHLEELNMAGGVPSLTQTILNKVLIPIPPLAEQARIVSILDQFDTLTASISEGLPKEIALRKQQYEYYREMLLAFPTPCA